MGTTYGGAVSSPIAGRLPGFLATTPGADLENAAGVTVPGLADPCDETLIAWVCTGDREALACLFQRYALLVRGVASRILRDTSEAEDLVQDLFIFIQRKCVIFDSSKSSARSWIVQMTYHRAIERRRYLTTRQFYSRGDAEGMRDKLVGIPTDESDYSAEAVFGRNGLEKVFETLSEDQRETLRLHFFEGYTLAEVATKLGQPHGNVRHHYYRALGKLRKQMFETTVRVTEPHGK
ncbi:MAG TPA: sigma-70 family RNA polymerase sigma factor [Candidatus Acidoferrales bacterium]|nr:sigma-70 family RNA polymerase sigma factor [Candidatus Acidoferrales bacterium]